MLRDLRNIEATDRKKIELYIKKSIKYSILKYSTKGVNDPEYIPAIYTQTSGMIAISILSIAVGNIILWFRLISDDMLFYYKLSQYCTDISQLKNTPANSYNDDLYMLLPYKLFKLARPTLTALPRESPPDAKRVKLSVSNTLTDIKEKVDSIYNALEPIMGTPYNPYMDFVENGFFISIPREQSLVNSIISNLATMVDTDMRCKSPYYESLLLSFQKQTRTMIDRYSHLEYNPNTYQSITDSCEKKLFKLFDYFKPSSENTGLPNLNDEEEEVVSNLVDEEEEVVSNLVDEEE